MGGFVIGVFAEEPAGFWLDREHVLVDTRFGRLPIKVARLDGVVVNAAPEYEACRAAAVERGASLKDVFAAAIAAWDSTRT